jgi:uncharacterized protein Smg (DUF494 family)
MGAILSPEQSEEILERIGHLETRLEEIEMTVQKAIVLLELQQKALEQQFYNNTNTK